MPDSSLDNFYRSYVKALQQGTAAIFVGAGLSRPSGLADWKSLLKTVATDLGLDVDREADLIALAQWHETKHGSRSQLNQLLIDEFTKDVQIHENHRLIASLPIQTVWTTNYDKLLEKAFEEAHKRVDAKITPENMATTVPHRAVTVYKMHGDISQPQKAVLTKEDYETYDLEREAFSIKLKGDLIEKTFLFLGFSFTDPNIDYILSRIRALLGKNQRTHYCIMRGIEKPKSRSGKAKAHYEYDRTKLDLRMADLKRYSIRPILIDDYSEITTILRELNQRGHLRDIFVSGSAHDYGPLGQDRVEQIARAIGQRIIKEGYNLVSGVGWGIGGSVVIGALESLYEQPSLSADERLVLRPFPKKPPQGMTLDQFWTRYREDMLGKSGVSIFLCGNREDPGTKKTVIAKGVLEEFGIAKKLKRHPIPIGATGHAAQKIWKEVSQSLDTFYPSLGVKAHFDTLGNANKSDTEIVDAVFAIIKKLNPTNG